jgi:nitroreductase
VGVYRTIKTMRAVRQFNENVVDDGIIRRILEAGRATGSSKNTQPWHFVVVRKNETLSRLAECGYYASHLREAAFAIAIVAAPQNDFDYGRAAQNMMLAAWGHGVASCIATMHREEAKTALAIPDNLKLVQVISFGYPRQDATPTIEGKPLKDVLVSLGRKPLNEIAHYETW